MTGSEGFLGKHLVSVLKASGAEVVYSDSLKGRDIRIWKDLGIYRSIDLIYHLAAKMDVTKSFKNTRDIYEINLLGTINVAELALRESAKIIFTSSYIYGIPQYLPVDENHPINPTNPYARSKLLAENILKAYNKDFNVSVVILRPFNIYGKGQKECYLIPTILNQLETGLVKLQDPLPKRDFIYVDDMIDCLLKAANCKEGFDVFNIGSGKSLSVQEIVNSIMNIYSKDFSVIYLDERRSSETIDCYANIDKAKRILKWLPKTSFEEGLMKTISG